MKAYPSLRRWLAAVVTAAVLAGVVVIGALSGRSGAGDKTGAEKKPTGGTDGWRMFGGSPSRNMANTRVKGLPAEWDIGSPKKKVKGKNIKWVTDLGSKSYAGPIVADGKVFVGTNNQKPRDPKYIDPKTKKPIDLGVLMTFDE